MYKIKRDIVNEIKEKRNLKKIADTIGITDKYLSNIINYNERAEHLSKTVAYAITKAINEEYEIQDVFDIVEE